MNSYEQLTPQHKALLTELWQLGFQTESGKGFKSMTPIPWTVTLPIQVGIEALMEADFEGESFTTLGAAHGLTEILEFIPPHERYPLGWVEIASEPQLTVRINKLALPEGISLEHLRDRLELAGEHAGADSSVATIGDRDVVAVWWWD